VYLSLCQVVVEDAAAVIDSYIFQYLHIAGVTVNFDDSNVSAGRKGGVRGDKISPGRQSFDSYTVDGIGWLMLNQFWLLLDHLGELGQSGRSRGNTAHHHLTVLHNKVLRSGFQQLSRHLKGLFAGSFGSEQHGAARYLGRATAEGANAISGQDGVIHLDLYLGAIHIEGCCGYLRKSGEVALTVGGNAALYEDCTVPPDAHSGGLLGNTRSVRANGAARDLGKSGDTDAYQF